jgi:hypothetical protein
MAAFCSVYETATQARVNSVEYHQLTPVFLKDGWSELARGIGQAVTIDTLADATGVKRETVRSRLKAVLSKTGLSGQQELVSLLAGKPSAAVRQRAMVVEAEPRAFPPRKRNKASARIRCEDKRLAQAGHFAAFFHCCVARTRFVHLSFRVKSAFANVV